MHVLGVVVDVSTSQSVHCCISDTICGSNMISTAELHINAAASAAVVVCAAGTWHMAQQLTTCLKF